MEQSLVHFVLDQLGRVFREKVFDVRKLLDQGVAWFVDLFEFFPLGKQVRICLYFGSLFSFQNRRLFVLLLVEVQVYF
jgi:hypothetical protein